MQPKKNHTAIRDPIHGLIEVGEFAPLFFEVLQSMEVQRLRRIKQLGLAHMVYPTAEHSRLTHSIGTAYLSLKMCEKLAADGDASGLRGVSIDKETCRNYLIAGLCHDIGHGPFSHAWEKLLSRRDQSEPSLFMPGGSTHEDKWHEDATQTLINNEEGELHQILKRHDPQLPQIISDILSGKQKSYFLSSIISSDIDADRADYILRDSYMCGIKYGNYDVDWLISNLSIGINSNGDRVIGLKEEKGKPILEQYLKARYDQYQAIYYHKTTLACEAMLVLLLTRLQRIYVKGDFDFPRFTRPMMNIISGLECNYRSILKIDDYSIWFLISLFAETQDVDDTAQDLAARLRKRHLFKSVPCSTADIEDFMQKPDAHEQILDIIRPHVPGDPKYYFFRDQQTCELFSKSLHKRPYFVNSKREAVPCKPRAADYEDYKVDRIYTVREAIPGLVKLISRDRSQLQLTF